MRSGRFGTSVRRALASFFDDGKIASAGDASFGGGVALVGIVVYAAAALVAFMYLDPPALSARAASDLPAIGSLPGDLPTYVVRFLLTFVLFGAGSLIVARLAGFGLRDLGLRGAGVAFRSPIYWVVFLLVAVVSALGAFQSGLSSYYPYSHTLLDWSIARSPWYLAIHVVCYFCLYYVPWEIFFRGLLVFPFLRAVGPQAPTGTLLAIASLQTLPSTIIHIGHPVGETATAILFGVITAVLVVRTRSLLPGLFMHATAGILLDLTIAARTAGLLP